MRWLVACAGGALMVKIGDKKTFKPSGFSSQIGVKDPATGQTRSRKVTGKVVYVHPAGRYYTVEVEEDGRKYRESFPCKS